MKQIFTILLLVSFFGEIAYSQVSVNRKSNYTIVDFSANSTEVLKAIPFDEKFEVHIPIKKGSKKVDVTEVGITMIRERRVIKRRIVTKLSDKVIGYSIEKTEDKEFDILSIIFKPVRPNRNYRISYEMSLSSNPAFDKINYGIHSNYKDTIIENNYSDLFKDADSPMPWKGYDSEEDYLNQMIELMKLYVKHINKDREYKKKK